MIQFNLLPDVKLEYIKARRNKRLVILSSIIIAGTSLGICVMLFMGVNVVQKIRLGKLNDDINKISEELKNEKDIDKILTVQNQLNSLDSLHDKKPAASRLIGYLSQITPNTVSISALNIDFTANTMSISGSSPALKHVNEFIDTMKFTSFKVAKETNTKPAFSNVILSRFSVNTDNNNGGYPATYDISLSFDPTIFDTTKSISLRVPQDKVTTRSVVEPTSDNRGGAQ